MVEPVRRLRPIDPPAGSRCDPDLSAGCPLLAVIGPVVATAGTAGLYGASTPAWNTFTSKLLPLSSMVAQSMCLPSVRMFTRP